MSAPQAPCCPCSTGSDSQNIPCNPCKMNVPKKKKKERSQTPLGQKFGLGLLCRSSQRITDSEELFIFQIMNQRPHKKELN